MLHKMGVFNDLIPKISSVIEKSERKLQKAIGEVLRSPKVYHERAVSPVKELLRSSPSAARKPAEHKIPTPQRSPTLEKHNDLSQDLPPGTASKQSHEKPGSPFIGDLLINIENIRESRCLLNGFQNELSQIKKDIEACIACKKNLNSTEEKEDQYCEKHEVYIPLLQMENVGSRSDKIKLFNTLKTEISLKKELENQLHNISLLERKLSKVKLAQNEDEIRAVEKALEFTKSYFNNLLVKQETERLLNKQQEMLKKKCENDCQDSENCKKCVVEKQIHELLGKVRENITNDLNAARQRLKIQKMPSIDIRKPLQVQTTLRLNIPPSLPTQEFSRNNVACETIVTEEKSSKKSSDREIQTRMSIRKPKDKGGRRGSKQKYASQEKDDNLKVIEESSVYLEELKDKLRAVGQAFGVQLEDFEAENRKQKHDKSQRIHHTADRKFPGSNKTPSELGFRRTVATQCDSVTSLDEPKNTKDLVLYETLSCSIDETWQPKNIKQTQTSVVEEDSNYLFGFREYLMKQTPDVISILRGDNKADVNIQVSLGESSDSFLEPKSVGVDTGSGGRMKLSKRKSCDFQGVTIVTPPDLDKIDKLSDTGSPKPVESEEIYTGFTMGKPMSSKKYRAIERTPSIKKMFLTPSLPAQGINEDEVLPLTPLEKSIQNPYMEPKYRMKNFAITRQESDLDMNENPIKGDAFYKSLISKEQLPERKLVTPAESRTQDKLSVEASSEAIRTINLENTSASEENSVLNPTMTERPETVEKEEAKQNKLIKENTEEEKEEKKGDHGKPKEESDNNETTKTEATDISQEYTKLKKLIGVALEEKGEPDDIKEIISKYHTKGDIEYSNSEYPRETTEESRNIKRTTDASEGNMDEEKQRNGRSTEDLDVVEIKNPKNSDGVSDESVKLQKEKEDENVDESSGYSLEKIEEMTANQLQGNGILPNKPTYEEKKVSIDEKFIDADKDSANGGKFSENDNNEEPKQETVLSLLSPTYKIRINASKDLKKRLLNEDVLLNCPRFFKSTKTFKKYEVSHDSVVDSEEIGPHVDSPNVVEEEVEGLNDNDEDSEYSKDVYSILNYRLPLTKNEKILPEKSSSNSKNRFTGNTRIAEESLEYARKCSEVGNHLDSSSMLSSEGEVRCKCQNLSEGECHRCPYEKYVKILKGIHSGIHYKDKISSHLILEKERKHYNHWVTYYSTKKIGDNSSSSSVDSTGANDQ